MTSVLRAALLTDEAGIDGVYCTHKTEPELECTENVTQLSRVDA